MDLLGFPFIGVLLSIGVLLIVLILVIFMRHRLKESQMELERVIEQLNQSDPDIEKSVKRLEEVRDEIDSLI